MVWAKFWFKRTIDISRFKKNRNIIIAWECVELKIEYLDYVTSLQQCFSRCKFHETIIQGLD